MFNRTMEVDSSANCASEINEIYVHGLVAAAMSLRSTIYGMKDEIPLGIYPLG